MREFAEDTYYNDFISMHRRITSSKNSYDKREMREIQKEKFRYISHLVGDLFDHKNSRKAYNTISNLIVTSLTSLDDKEPVDIYSGKPQKQENEENNEEDRDVLVQEFKYQIDEYKNILSKGRTFLEVVTRFSKQYEVVNNIFYSPMLDEFHKKMPN